MNVLLGIFSLLWIWKPTAGHTNETGDTEIWTTAASTSAVATQEQPQSKMLNCYYCMDENASGRCLHKSNLTQYFECDVSDNAICISLLCSDSMMVLRGCLNLKNKNYLKPDCSNPPEKAINVCKRTFPSANHHHATVCACTTDFCNDVEFQIRDRETIKPARRSAAKALRSSLVVVTTMAVFYVICLYLHAERTILKSTL